MAKLTEKQKLAQMLGLEAPDEEEEIQTERAEEGVAAALEQPDQFSKYKCKHCGRTFAANRRAVGYCRPKCRRAGLKAFFKVASYTPREPNGDRDKKYVWDVWWGKEPLVIPPEVLPHLEGLLNFAGIKLEDLSESSTSSDFRDKPLQPLEDFGESSDNSVVDTSNVVDALQKLRASIL